MSIDREHDAAARSTHVLVVDPDEVVCAALEVVLEESGFETDSARDVATALERIDDAARNGRPFAVAVVEMLVPGAGIELIRTIRRKDLGVVPVAIAGAATIEAAVEAVRNGAVDYLTKPLVDRELVVAVEKAAAQHVLVAENQRLRRELSGRDLIEGVVGSDDRMRRIFDVVESVAPTRTTVLMCGESGTGKSMIARAIHGRSPRADEPFVEISCGSIPETLLESELFGHVKGAFTGAYADKPGRFLAADGGTLFLDEINSASPGMQLKLLRVLQERRFEPVGSTESIEVDVRVLLASNQPLEELVAAGTFRQDLYYRINVVSIDLPPLRDRIGDIPHLAEHFLAEKVEDVGRAVTSITDEAMLALRAYAWPGNVRELANVIERAVVLTRTSSIDAVDLPPHVVDRQTPIGPNADGLVWDAETPIPLREALEGPERAIILAALEANDWNRNRTADQLQINRTTLYKKIKQYGLAG